jgi:DNA-binding winged helix-turn-helix (wHTH) protein
MRTSESTKDFGRLLRSQALALAQFHPRPDKPFVTARTESTRAAPTEILFGPFRLLARQFLLLQGERPVHLGSRALEILIVLLERPGELVSKQELMDRVWPNIFVEPANLTVHLSALRRALRDERDGNRFIINVPGRGYSFVASVEVVERRRPSAMSPRKGLLRVIPSSSARRSLSPDRQGRQRAAGRAGIGQMRPASGWTRSLASVGGPRNSDQAR